VFTLFGKLNQVSKNCTFLVGMVWLVLLMLTGCDVIIPKDYEVDEKLAVQKYAQTPLNQLIIDANQKIEHAKQEELFFYSPNNYQTAIKSMQVARAFVSDPEQKLKVLTNIYRIDLALDDAYSVKKIVQREMPDVLKVRESLDYLQASKTHSAEYGTLLNAIVRLTEQIEKDKEAMFKTPKDQASFTDWKNVLMAQLEDFRARVVRFNYLNQADNLVADAEQVDAKTIAPVTYAQTIEQRDQALDYINHNMTNMQGIYDVGKKYYAAALRLLLITREINSMTDQGEDAREAYVLRIEQLLAKLANALQLGDISTETFSVQTDKLSSAATALIEQKQSNNGKVQATESSRSKAKPSPVKSSTKQDFDPNAHFPEIKGVPASTTDLDNTQSMKKQLTLLTDQVYQLSAEKNEWTSQRAQLLDKIKKLQKQLEQLQKP